MLRRNITKTSLAVAILMAIGTTAQAAKKPTLEELWQVIQNQQKEIQSLKSHLSKTDEKVEATGEMVEKVSHQSAAGHGSSGKTTIGGYGELHYNNLNSGNEIDFHRFVLYFGHEFSDDMRFVSELELEHSVAGEGKNGEIELEQAYIEMDLDENHRAKAGLFLLPVGILNTTHEPNTFYGVERNNVEKNIIPTTWWEAGVGLSGELGSGWGYDLALHSGLATPTTGSKAFNYKPRDARRKVSEAPAQSSAVTSRIKWTGMPGVELAATVQYQEDIAQGTTTEEASATLFETHGIVQRGKFGLKALYAQWDIDGSGAATLGRDEQTGWYIEPSFKVTEKLGLFARYNEWDNEAGNSTDTKIKQTDIGLNYWLNENVVLKFDAQSQSGNSDDDGINLGIGYQF